MAESKSGKKISPALMKPVQPSEDLAKVENYIGRNHYPPLVARYEQLAEEGRARFLTGRGTPIN